MEIIDNYKEHIFHHKGKFPKYDNHCSTCFSEERKCRTLSTTTNRDLELMSEKSIHSEENYW